MMGKRQFIKYHLRSRLPFYLVFIFNGLILLLFAFLFEEVADVLYYALTILAFVSVIMVIWDLSRSFKTSKAAYLYEEITPLSPLEFYLAQALENARESQMVQTEEERKRYTDLMDYYTLWVHQIKTPIAASQLLLQDVRVISDEKWLLVIIEQVLSNSLKYTKTGGIDIYFKDNRLYLKDTGIGIKNSDILRVFERGFSGYNGRMTQQSSGLGLYLSKKIADQLGHEISISSQVGQGTTVSIHFQKQKLAIDY